MRHKFLLIFIKNNICIISTIRSFLIVINITYTFFIVWILICRFRSKFSLSITSVPFTICNRRYNLRFSPYYSRFHSMSIRIKYMISIIPLLKLSITFCSLLFKFSFIIRSIDSLKIIMYSTISFSSFVHLFTKLFSFLFTFCLEIFIHIYFKCTIEITIRYSILSFVINYIA